MAPDVRQGRVTEQLLGRATLASGALSSFLHQRSRASAWSHLAKVPFHMLAPLDFRLQDKVRVKEHFFNSCVTGVAF